MSAEIEMALAEIFRNKGKSALTEKEIVFTASIDLRWFSPKEAQKLLDISMESEMLAKDGEKLRPAFDYKSVDTPKGFKPSPEMLKTAARPKGMFLKLVDHISKEKGIPQKEVISQVNETQDRMNVDIEVAALIVAKNLGVNIKPQLDEVEEEIATRYRER